MSKVKPIEPLHVLYFHALLLMYPASQRAESKLLLRTDALLLLVSHIAILYWIFQYPTYAARL